MTLFSNVYNSFLGKITDDMYLELTPEDTVRDLRNILIEAIPNFEFPRKNLYDYVIEEKEESEVSSTDFVLKEISSQDSKDNKKYLIEKSSFKEDLSQEEISILSELMMLVWTQRQITSIENIRMKYSGPDFKMTSQANHLAKLLTLQERLNRHSLHMQRLYKRRRFSQTGAYESNWSILRENSAIEE